jgi:hypothetical protein
MSIQYQEISAGVTQLGNYRISETTQGEFSLTPAFPLPKNTTWLEAEVICASYADAERIAIVFTSQDELNSGVREMLRNRAQEMQARKDRSDSEQKGNDNA